jgi:hypothetical protein
MAGTHIPATMANELEHFMSLVTDTVPQSAKLAPLQSLSSCEFEKLCASQHVMCPGRAAASGEAPAESVGKAGPASCPPSQDSSHTVHSAVWNLLRDSDPPSQHILQKVSLFLC